MLLADEAVGEARGGEAAVRELPDQGGRVPVEAHYAGPDAVVAELVRGVRAAEDKAVHTADGAAGAAAVEDEVVGAKEALRA